MIIAALLILIGFLVLIIGYSMAIFTSEKQALHDVIARCLIVNDKVQSGTIPWKSLIVTMVVAFIAGRVMLPFVPNGNVDSTSLPDKASVEQPEETPPSVLTLLQGLTIDNLEPVGLATPKTYPICGGLQLLSPTSQETLDVDSKLQWTSRGVVYVARLIMKEHAGRMRVITPDVNGGLKVIILRKNREAVSPCSMNM